MQERESERERGLDNQACKGMGAGVRAGAACGCLGTRGACGLFPSPWFEGQPRPFAQKLLAAFNYCNILKRCDSELDMFIL